MSSLPIEEHDVGFEVLTAADMKSTTIFWDIMPYSPLNVNCAFTLVSCSAYSSTLKIESIDSQRTTRRYFPEDSNTLQTFLIDSIL
jgi:hypothetical protein